MMVLVSSRRLDAVFDRLGRVVEALSALGPQLQGTLKTMSDLDAKISALQTDVANLTTVDQSAVALISGLSGQLSFAIQQAKSVGMTDGQAAQLDALDQALKGQAQSLAQAVAANTPAAAGPTNEPPPPSADAGSGSSSDANSAAEPASA